MSRFPVAIVCFVLFHQDLLAETSTYVDGGTKHTVSWNDLVGKIVTVDGLAWGAHEKGLGQHLVLPASRVYVQGVDYVKHDLNGRLVWVSGFLRKSRAGKAPPGAQGFSEPFDYFSVESFAVERIDQVRYDQLLPSTFDWIVVGGKTGDALRSLKRHKHQEHRLARPPAKKGTTPHSYRITEDEVLLFYDSGGRIESMTRIKLNDPQKRNDDERIPVKAYRLKPRD